MLRSYILISLRNLLKNKTFSFINIFGLAVGMASFLLIALWIRQELNVNQFHKKRDQIFMVMSNLKGSDRVVTTNTAPFVLSRDLRFKYPEIKRSAVTGWQESRFLEYRDQKLRSVGFAVEPDFLKIFSYPLIKGNINLVLNDINSIVITEALAEKLFGQEDPMEKLVKLNDKDVFKVTGVMKNISRSQSEDFFEYLIPFEYFKIGKNWIEDAETSVTTYVELKKGASSYQVDEKIKKLPIKYGSKEIELFLHPLTKWHLYSQFEDGKPAGGRIETVRFFAIIAVLILLIACVNFTNLSTARSQKRAKEVGIRKVIGVKRKNLILQFLGESLFLTFLAGLIAIVIVVLFVDSFNTLTESHLKLSLEDNLLILAFLSFVLITGVIAGIYPAFYLSSFKPILALKGKLQTGTRAFGLRQTLVVVQFTFAIAMIIASIIIKKQIEHAQSRENGYAKDKLVYYQYYGGIKNFPLLKNALLSTGIASSVTHSSAPITEVWNETSKIDWQGKDPAQVTDFKLFCADDGLEETFGLKIAEGRSFNLRDFPADSSACLLNETALKTMGLKDPVGQVITCSGSRWRITGVVKDFILESPYLQTAPLIILGARGWFNIVHIKLKGDLSIQESLKQTDNLFKKYNPAFPFESAFVDQVYARKFDNERRISKLSGLFTGLTILISCLGLFGLAGYMAQNKIKEIGVRKVLGATTVDINLLLTRDFLKLILISLAIASPIAFIIMENWLENYEYRIAISWWIFPFAGILTILMALATVGVISIKAAVANPVKSLRTE